MDKEKIMTFLVNRISSLSGLPISKIDVNRDFTEYGIDSVSEISLIGELNDLLKTDLDLQILLDFPTIESIATYLENHVKNQTKHP
jgi:acyl carrier protein